MARTSRWSEGTLDKGVVEFKLTSWKYFSDFVNQELINYTTYVFRGHGNSTWKLEPTLDRIIKTPTSPKRELHLENFKYATRGRRGPNPSLLQDENDWWALGQHHGLNTPLLDWTESPFVALYFAASTALREKTSGYTIFSLSQNAIKRYNHRINTDTSVALINDRKPTVKIVRPFSDENSRLVSQRGLFTRGPNNLDIESWIKNFNEANSAMELIKIQIPTTGASDCLRYLNRMNINHLTLFPDLTGASAFCNSSLSIQKY